MTTPDPEFPYDPARDQEAMRVADARKPGADQVERASCQHMVQSNGTCGNGPCPNYGKT